MATQLVALPAIERLSPRIIRILGGNAGKFTLQGTNTYLVGTGRWRILIDTGEGRPAWISSLRTTLEQENASIESALLSHWHYDHVNGVDDLLTIAPDAKVYKNDPDTDSGQLAISDGQAFHVEGASLMATHTPGHTKDHMTFVLAEEDAMFTADNVLGQGTAVFEDLPTYLSSLDRMRHMFKGRAYPGHGPVLEDGAAKICEYLQHRQHREDQVIRTLKSVAEARHATLSPMDIVKVVYSDVREELHPAAAGGVTQILEKLQGEARNFT
ncbi:hypothetical protein N3K66_008122 [Trichothecium roseum]|uniref:Uncharacterized protein n=1 Tax=Trichothecium roseum TaxID=47278 RepID=A0ACC0USP8_9HYPO|nr:hypothetical protein N3K66_008122 [Trichothecium roseum]